MTDRIPDLTPFENLPIYEVAQEWERETNRPIIIHLHEMALAISQGSLKIEISDSMKLVERWEKQKKYRNASPSWFWNESSRVVSSIRNVPIYTKWTPDKSRCIQHLKNPPNSRIEPTGLKGALYKEQINIKREHFRAWCESKEYPLPKFWFGDSKQVEHSTSPHEEHNSREKPESTPHTERMDPLRALIVKVLQEGISSDPESVWLALLDRKGDGTIICSHEDEKGTVIKWKDSEGNFKTLTKRALRGRIQRLK
ncbi:MAG: hypothetical protein R6V18_03820 [Desulfuromonadaceae bacterium]